MYYAYYWLHGITIKSEKLKRPVVLFYYTCLHLLTNLLFIFVFSLFYSFQVFNKARRHYLFLYAIHINKVNCNAVAVLKTIVRWRQMTKMRNIPYTVYEVLMFYWIAIPLKLN